MYVRVKKKAMARLKKASDKTRAEREEDTNAEEEEEDDEDRKRKKVDHKGFLGFIRLFSGFIGFYKVVDWLSSSSIRLVSGFIGV